MENKDNKMIFEAQRKDIDNLMNKLTVDKKVEIKDLRTYMATAMAKRMLEDEGLPTLPESEKEIKKKKQQKKFCIL